VMAVGQNQRIRDAMSVSTPGASLQAREGQDGWDEWSGHASGHAWHLRATAVRTMCSLQAQLIGFCMCWGLAYRACDWVFPPACPTHAAPSLSSAKGSIRMTSGKICQENWMQLTSAA